MLTKDDLKAIRGIVREEIEAEASPLKAELSGEIKMARIEIQLDVRKLADRVKDLEIAVRKIGKDFIGEHFPLSSN